MDLFPNETVILSFVLFILTYLITSRLIIRPVLNVLSVREKEIFGAEQRAAEQRAVSEKSKQEYYTKVQGLRSSGTSLRNNERVKALQEEKELINVAQDKFRGTMDKMEYTLNQQIVEVQDDLWKESSRLARQVASKILGRSL